MAKKCVICSAQATYCVKGSTTDCYCDSCAVEHFGDVMYLVKIEEAARRLKDQIDQLAEEGIKLQSEGEIEPVDQLAEEGIELPEDE